MCLAINEIRKSTESIVTKELKRIGIKGNLFLVVDDYVFGCQLVGVRRITKCGSQSRIRDFRGFRGFFQELK